MRAIMNFIREEEGATALEYGLLAALIAGVLTAAVTLLGGNIRALFERLAGDIGAA
ncbi:Flp family type IVb pilin [Desulfovibrio psychrotolerans]|uniref:Pilin n=1 Tax=Desulfovibrio psychrotolerans TaxID=415242 RepID=A0A7J0BV08_9BACT|nr:Flp family type IVb pilin [Desulfovibrio psychrotolerans]GFM37005.1 pilin [Desulfovibrio psychrotolerans]